jgi:hypothetical protein
MEVVACELSLSYQLITVKYTINLLGVARWDRSKNERSLDKFVE